VRFGLTNGTVSDYMEITRESVTADSSGATVSKALSAGVTYQFRWEFGNVELLGEAGGTIAVAVNRIKVWPEGKPEPLIWTLDAKRSTVWTSSTSAPFIEGFWT
jgi:hypothetical protein